MIWNLPFFFKHAWFKLLLNICNIIHISYRYSILLFSSSANIPLNPVAFLFFYFLTVFLKISFYIYLIFYIYLFTSVGVSSVCSSKPGLYSIRGCLKFSSHCCNYMNWFVGLLHLGLTVSININISVYFLPPMYIYSLIYFLF